MYFALIDILLLYNIPHVSKIHILATVKNRGCTLNVRVPYGILKNNSNRILRSPVIIMVATEKVYSTIVAVTETSLMKIAMEMVCLSDLHRCDTVNVPCTLFLP